jgi:hypothetical protein
MILKLLLGGTIIAMVWLFLKKLMLINKDNCINPSFEIAMKNENMETWNTGDIIIQDMLRHKNVFVKGLERLSMYVTGCNLCHSYMVIKDEKNNSIGLLGFGFRENKKFVEGISNETTIDKKWHLRSPKSVFISSEKIVRVPIKVKLNNDAVLEALKIFGQNRYAKNVVMNYLLLQNNFQGKYICSSALLKILEIMKLADFSTIKDLNRCTACDILSPSIFQKFSQYYHYPYMINNQ